MSRINNIGTGLLKGVGWGLAIGLASAALVGGLMVAAAPAVATLGLSWAALGAAGHFIGASWAAHSGAIVTTALTSMFVTSGLGAVTGALGGFFGFVKGNSAPAIPSYASSRAMPSYGAVVEHGHSVAAAPAMSAMVQQATAPETNWAAKVSAPSAASISAAR